VERGVCPTATLYSLAAAYKRGGVGANSAQLSFTGTMLYRFEVPIGRNAKFIKKWDKIEEYVIRFLSQTNLILLFGPRITVQNFIKVK